MTTSVWAQSLSPGNEQRDFWGTEAGKTKGSRNMPGISDPVIDEIIELIISAPDRETLVSTTMALDRVLLHGHYLVPHYFVPTHRTAYWNKFERPEITAPNILATNTWWIDVEKEKALNQ